MPQFLAVYKHSRVLHQSTFTGAKMLSYTSVRQTTVGLCQDSVLCWGRRLQNHHQSVFAQRLGQAAPCSACHHSQGGNQRPTLYQAAQVSRRPPTLESTQHARRGARVAWRVMVHTLACSRRECRQTRQGNRAWTL